MAPDDEKLDDVDLLSRELGLLDRTAAERVLGLRDGFLNLEKWVLFVGAGVSRSAGLPTWDELTRHLAQRFGVECPTHPADNAFPSILEECMARAPTPEDFWEAVADEVCRGEPSEIHDLLLQLPFQAFVTINFDCLLEHSHEQLEGVSEPRVMSDPDLQAVDVGGRRLIHLHGRCREGTAQARLDDESTVLTQAAYSRAYGLSTLPRVIEATISAYSLLLVGTSLADWQIRLLLNEVRDRERLLAQSTTQRQPRQLNGYALVETDGTESPSAAQWTWPGKALGIEPIFYLNTDGRHAALLNTLRWLARNSAPAPARRYEVVE